MALSEDLGPLLWPCRGDIEMDLTVQPQLVRQDPGDPVWIIESSGAAGEDLIGNCREIDMVPFESLGTMHRED
jgi:hypothetical protein